MNMNMGNFIVWPTESIIMGRSKNIRVNTAWL